MVYVSSQWSSAVQSSTHIMIYAHNNAHTQTDRQTEPRVSTHISSHTHTHTQRERESVFCITSIARFIAISLSLLWFLHIFILTAFPLAIPSSFSHCPSFRVERNPLCLIHFFPSCFQWITPPSLPLFPLRDRCIPYRSSRVHPRFPGFLRVDIFPPDLSPRSHCCRHPSLRWCMCWCVCPCRWW